MTHEDLLKLETAIKDVLESKFKNSIRKISNYDKLVTLILSDVAENVGKHYSPYDIEKAFFRQLNNLLKD